MARVTAFASTAIPTLASFTGTREDLRMAANLEPDDELRGSIVGNKVQVWAYPI
jgi:hypothetical protein